MARNVENLPRPPRDVPLSLRLALRFGGVGGFIGWAFFSMSMIFVAVFVGLGNFGDALALSMADRVRTEGVALGWEHTNTIVNDEPVLANGASFTYKGIQHECRSYAVAEGLAQGTPVIIEHDRDNPAVCRIEGMDVSLMPWWVLLIIAPFLLVGVIFVGFRWRAANRHVRLLRDGRVAWGTLVDRRSTNVTINDERQYAYTFEFEDEVGRTHTVSCKTVDTYAVEDEPQEAVLYDPHAPERAMVVDSEAVLKVNRDGSWRAPGVRVLPALIAPIVGVVLLGVTISVF